jgi:tetratricopeptide (TPR) repeat protein
MIRQPYPGARPFGPPERDLFFGRSQETRVLAEWWHDNRLTYLVGPAGRGKTSLLCAALLPLLAEEKNDVLPVGQFSVGVAFPSSALPDHNPYSLALLRTWSPGEPDTELAGLTISGFIERRLGTGSVFAAIDPVDELPTGASPFGNERRAQFRDHFLTELAGALEAHPRLHLLVAGREEAVTVVARRLGNGLRYEIPPLTWQAAVEAVCGPMARIGRSIVAGAADRLITDVVERYSPIESIEPAILQLACAHLWNRLRGEANPLTVKHVRAYADVEQALADRARAVISEVADDHDLPARRLSAWLRNTFITELGTPNKQYEGPSGTGEMPNGVARSFEDGHLLTSSFEAGAWWYRLLSDRLIEPIRQIADAERDHAGMTRERPSGYLRAAERALAGGKLDLARRCAMEFERYARDLLDASGEPIALPRAKVYDLLGKTYSLLGNLAYESEKPQEAAEHYKEAKEQYAAAGDNHAVGYQLAAIGRILQEQGHSAEAVMELDAAVSRIPNDPVLRVAYAMALWQLGEGRAAVAQLNSALAMDGASNAALQARGEILAELGEARAAIRDLDRLPITAQPTARAAHGLALARLGERRAARKEIQDALAIAERNGRVLLYAARAFALIGDRGAAEEHARQATLATDPPLSAPQQEAARKLANRHPSD